MGIVEKLKKIFGAKPKEEAVPAPPPPSVTPPIVKPPVEITKVKGIGSKRAEQLKSMGIHTAENLAKASAEELAMKMKTSSKMTGRWIEEAKKLMEEDS